MIEDVIQSGNLPCIKPKGLKAFGLGGEVTLNEKIVDHFKKVPGEGASLFMNFISAMNFIPEKGRALVKK